MTDQDKPNSAQANKIASDPTSQFQAPVEVDPPAYLDEEPGRASFIPHDINAEQSLLGALLFDPPSYEKIAEKISPQSFYKKNHQHIYKAIATISSVDQAIDPVTVAAQLVSMGVIQSSGKDQGEAIAYLTTLFVGVSNAANIERYAQIVLEKHFLREILHVGNELVSMALNPQGTSANDILAMAESKLFALTQSRFKETGLDHINTSIKKVIEEIETEQERAEGESDGEHLAGISTGFIELNTITDGLQKDNLIIVAARPAMGKTTLALNLAEAAALGGGLPVAIFSLEMSATEIAKRLISALSRIEYKRIKQKRDFSHQGLSEPVQFSSQNLTKNGLEDYEWARVTEAIEKLSSSSIHIDETPALPVQDIRTRCRKLARQTGKIGLVIIDYLQLMSPPIGYNTANENKAAQIAETTRNLKALAKELGCPVIALSQLNRSLEQRPNKRPVMSDLRESGAIEQDADLILFIYRDEVYHPDSMDIGSAEIIIGKQRNGPVGTVKVNFLDYCTRFEDSL